MSAPRHTATFVLSTGRCGTQWLAQALAQTPGAGRVEHEPLGPGYRARRWLGGGELAALPLADRARVETHVAGIEATLEREDYFEAGFPCWGALPWLCRRFAGRVRVVHLTRHPVPVAYSWLAHSAYVPPLLPHLPEKIFVHPTDAGAAFPEYAAGWDALHPFERCLYFWAEVHALGLRLETSLGVPWLRLDMRELFAAPGLEKLCTFLGVACAPELIATTREVIDEHRFHVPDWIEPSVVARHPRVVEVARALGYDPLAADVAALKRRYAPHLA